jgi:hypothetical protein
MTTSHRPINVAVLDDYQGVARAEAVYCRASDNASAFIGGFRLWAKADGGRRPLKKRAASLLSEKRRTPVNHTTN